MAKGKMKVKRSAARETKSANVDVTEKNEPQELRKASRKVADAVERTASTMESEPKKYEWPEGKHLYMVELQGVKQGAIIPADGKAEAKERFFELLGIINTDRTVVAAAVEEEHGVHVYDPGETPEQSERTSGAGLINYFPKPKGKLGGGKKVEATEEDDE